MSNASELIQEMQTYYHHRAADYDVSMGYDQPEVVAQLADVIEHLRQLVTGKRVLEIACGPCFWTEQIYDCTHSVLATDYNQSTLEQAALKQLPAHKVQLQQANAYQLSDLPHDFDVVLAIDWLAHVPMSRMRDFLHDLHLHMKGQVVFCDQLPGSKSWTGKFDSEGNHLQSRHLKNDASYTVIKHFFSDTEIANIFSDFLVNVEIDRYPDVQRIVLSYSLNPTTIE